jgi:hypothetical protein
MWASALLLFFILAMAAAASSSQSSPRPEQSPQTKQNSWAAQLKPKRRTSCEDENEMNEHNYQLLQDIVQHCDQYPMDIGIIHNSAAKQQKNARMKPNPWRCSRLSFRTSPP